jgi:AraC-like DNA-binding protein
LNLLNMNDIAEKAAANAWFTIVGRTAMVATLGVTGWLVQGQIAVQTDLKVLANTVNFSMQERYRADDARRDFQLRDLKIDTIAMRLSDLEHEVRAYRADTKNQQNERSRRRE